MSKATLRAFGACLVSVLAVATAAPTSAQPACYGPMPNFGNYFKDLCGQPLEATYQTNGAYKNAVVAVGSTSYLLYGYPNSLDVYTLTPNPMSPARLTTQMPLPWTPDPGSSTHEGIVDHLRKFAVLDGFGYAFVGMFTYGWDFLEVDSSPRFLKVGYAPVKVLDVSRGYINGVLFRGSDGKVYLAGQAIDQTSVDGRDSSIKIFDVTNPAGLSYATMQPVTTVPVGHTYDPAPWNTFPLGNPSSLTFDVFAIGNKTYLSAKNTSGQAAVIVDVTSPADILNGVTPKALWTVANSDAKLWNGAWAFDGVRGRLYVGALSDAVVYVFDLPLFSTNAPPTWRSTVRWRTASGTLNISRLLLKGDLLVAWSGTSIGYLSLQGDGDPLKLPDEADATTLTRVCTGAYGISAQTISPFTVPGDGQNVYVARSLLVYGDILQIHNACMSTTPKPSLAVSGGTANACTPSPAPAVEYAVGFPGDTFTILNTSWGNWTSPQLSVSPAPSPAVGGASPTWTWASSAGSTPRDYTFDLTVYDSSGVPYRSQDETPSGSRAVYLCKDPNAGIYQVSCSNNCPALTGENVTLSALPPYSEGHPSSFHWIVKKPDLTTDPPQAAISITQTLAVRGMYTVYVVAHYAFAAPDIGCTDPVYSALNLASNGTYDSCTWMPLDSQPFSVGAIILSQGANTTGPFVVGSDIAAQASYRLGPNYTADFQWQLDTATPGTPTANFTPSSSGWVTGRIAANSLPKPPQGQTAPHTITLSKASATYGTDTVNATVAPKSFNVIDCVAPADATVPWPSNGATGVATGWVTLTWQKPSGTGPFTYRVTDEYDMVPYCASVDTESCRFPFSTAGATYRWMVITRSPCGGAPSTSAVWSFRTAGATPTPTPTPPPSGGLTIRSGKNPANTGELVSFTFSPKVSQTGDTLTFDFGDLGRQTIPYDSLCQVVACDTATHTYLGAGTFTVRASGKAGGKTVSGSLTQTIISNCQLPSAPTAAFTYNPPQPIAGQNIQFTDLSSGGPTAWAWNFGDGMPPLIAAGSSTAKNPTYKYTQPGTYTVTLTATNCRGSSQQQLQVVVLPQCSVTEPPVADFSWAPTGAVPGFPEQQQPYVGQQVTLTDHSTNNPFSWYWYDFQEGAVNATVTTPTFAFTWHEQGPKNVRMAATNCIGGSPEVMHTIQIYDDVRHVVAEFTWSPEAPQTGVPVTLVAAQGPSYGEPDDFTWTFDDGTPSQTGSSVTHTFDCGGDQKVTLTARRDGHGATARKMVPVAGKACGPESVMAVDAAKLNGLNGTSWRTDVRIFNPGEEPSRVWLEFLPVGQNNVTPFKAGPYTIGARATLVLNNILDWVATTLGQDFSKTALRVTYDVGDDAPVVMARTYTPSPSGGTYGQFAPGIEVIPNTTPSPLWITGLRNNGLAEGFRTNYSLVNLRDDPGGVSNIRFTLFDAAGTAQDTKVLGLAPYGYLQDSVKNLFGGKFENIGTFSLKIDVPSDADIQAYASVMDNKTGDPVLIPAGQAADSVIYLPAVAHLSGEAGTVWRTDLQLTNPDTTGAHVWEVEFTPKSNNLPIVAQNVTLAPNQSLSTDDLVAALYGPMLPTDAQTSGVVRISMGRGDTSNVMPIVAARSYNLTPNGTFGQSIMPLWAAKGISADSENKRLLITGMSSEDIARTNLAFVSLSDTQGVDFSVLFYDESGSLLNPHDMVGTPTPYTFAIGPGGWDQDKLENRFRRAFKAELPANLRSISAVITIRGGGPGFVYATVIDKLTGDPNFIPAQPAP